MLTVLKTKLSCVIGTAESKLGGIVDMIKSKLGNVGSTPLSQNSVVSLTAELDLGGVKQTTIYLILRNVIETTDSRLGWYH